MILPDAKALLSSLPTPILLIDDVDMVLLANDAAENFFGRGRSRMEQQRVTHFFHVTGEDLDALLRHRDGDVLAQTVTIELDDGRTAHARLLIAQVQDHPGLRMIQIDVHGGPRDHNIGNDRAGEQVAFGAPAVLSHEIKNPLAGIKGAAQLLARKVDAKQRRMTDLIISEVDRIARIIDQMQRLGSHRPPNIAANNIHVVLDRAIQTIRAANRDLPVISISFDPSLPDVMVDRDAAMQVLINLLQNAIEATAATPDAAITVTSRFVMGGLVRHADVTGDDGKPIRLPVEVTVADNGSGVPEAIRDELFSPFVTSKRDGQGLGLAIVRKLMRDMNGRILYERDVDAGLTLFRMQMPIAGRSRRS